MYGKQRAAAVVATLGILAVAGCSTSSSGTTTSAPPAGGSASASTPIASSSAVAKAKQQATACLQQTGTAGLLSSSGRSKLITCLENIVPPAEREAFKTCMTSAAVSDQVWTKAGREKLTSTSLQACLNTAAAATPSASLRHGVQAPSVSAELFLLGLLNGCAATVACSDFHERPVGRPPPCHLEA